jgi:hypothetical protein
MSDWLNEPHGAKCSECKEKAYVILEREPYCAKHARLKMEDHKPTIDGFAESLIRQARVLHEFTELQRKDEANLTRLSRGGFEC